MDVGLDERPNLVLTIPPLAMTLDAPFVDPGHEFILLHAVVWWRRILGYYSQGGEKMPDHSRCEICTSNS